MTKEEIIEIVATRPFTDAEFGELIKTNCNYAHYPVMLDTPKLWYAYMDVQISENHTQAFTWKGVDGENEEEIILKAYMEMVAAGWVAN